MTIVITKTKLAIAIVAMALIGAGTAMAVDDNPFTDVPDSGDADAPFFSEPVEWLWDNGLTTGTSATTFSPNDTVTRGQYAAFNFRYDQNIVQPALADLQAEADAAQASADALNTPGRIIGMVRVRADGAISAQWMENGETVVVTRRATGDYAITWGTNGFNVNTDAGIVQLITGPSESRISSFNGDMLVFTDDSTGTSSDEQFWAYLLADLPS